MGRRHLRVALSEGLNVTTLCDQNREVAEQAKHEEQLADAVATDDPHLLLASKLDCLIVATTAPSHEELVTNAAEAEIPHVLCEKPIATSIAGADRMLAAAKRASIRLAINHQMRFMEQYIRVREIIESEAFGDWSSLTVVAGNFGLAMNGVHYFELFRWLSGEEISEVTAWLADDLVPNPRGDSFEDKGGSVRASTPSGKRLYLESWTDQGHGIKATYAGTAGIAVADELAGTIDISVRRDQDRDLPSTRYGCASVDRREEVPPADVIEPTRKVLRSLLQGSGYPTAEDGIHALRALVAAHVSAAKRETVDPRTELPEDMTLPIA